MSKKRKPKRIDKKAIANNLVSLKLERTRIIGDMFSLADTSEEYQALHKRLEDLNEAIETILQGLRVKA